MPEGFLLRNYKVKEMLLCQKSNPKFGKRPTPLEIERRASVKIDEDFWFRILLTNKRDNQYAVISITRKLNSLRSYVMTVDEFNKQIVPESFLKSTKSHVSLIKLGPNGEILRFMLNRKINKTLRAPGTTSNLTARELESFAIGTNELNFYIDDKRNPFFEGKIRMSINQEIFASMREAAAEAAKKA
jgi:hypothetical protein